jgi:hypothetical protein
MYIPGHGIRINAAVQSLMVRCFIDEQELQELLHGNNVLDEISLWPRDTVHFTYEIWILFVMWHFRV